MGFFDIPDWMHRFAEDEQRLRTQLAKFTELQDQAARIFAADQAAFFGTKDRAVQKIFANWGLFDHVESPLEKMTREAQHSLAELCKANAAVEAAFPPHHEPSWMTADRLMPDIEPIDDRIDRIVKERVKRELAKRDATPLERDPTLYGADGVKRRPGFKAPEHGEDEED